MRTGGTAFPAAEVGPGGQAHLATNSLGILGKPEDMAHVVIVAITYRYTDDVAARDHVLPEHRDHLRRLTDQGVLLVSGPYPPDEPRGALLLFRAGKDQVTA